MLAKVILLCIPLLTSPMAAAQQQPAQQPAQQPVLAGEKFEKLKQAFWAITAWIPIHG